MKISSRARYAFCALIDLALSDTRRTVNAISEAQGLSISYAEQIFKDLRKGGFIKGRRGPGGGCVLAKDPADICLYDVVVCLDERKHEYGGAHGGYQPFQRWDDLSDNISELLKNITLESCLEENAQAVN